ncbi:MAG: HEAT repeat domain-containing protein [Deltaproteobacteria bacterium]|nr:HEAT repeat domain-containing protein [Deltaproteobacteria bacterium]
MRRSFPIFLLAALTVAALPAPAPAAEHDERLLLALAAYHEDPPAEALDFLGASREAALEAVARDESQMRLRRIRAISVLVREDGEAGRRLAAEVIGDARWSWRLRIAATRALGNYQQHREGTAALLRRATFDADPGVRETAVRQLTLIDSPEARLALEELRGRERHVAVRVALRDALLKANPGATLPREGRQARELTPATVKEVTP